MRRGIGTRAVFALSLEVSDLYRGVMLSLAWFEDLLGCFLGLLN